MAKGSTASRLPVGLWAIVPPPPWHYSGDVVGVEYWADPKATAAFLPEGLTPDPVSNGHVTMMFLDLQVTARKEEYLDPARYQYRAALMLIDARRGDMPVSFCPLTFVDNDSAMARGWVHGFPNRLGSIYLTRTFAAPGPAMAPVAAGGRFAASLSRHGRRLADARITLEQQDENTHAMLDRPTLRLRQFPRLEAVEPGQPEVNEFAEMPADKIRVVDLWVGDAEFDIPDAYGEELSSLVPVRVGSGFRYGLAFSTGDLRVVS
jgi:acetoacetate decarboxylase